MFTLLPIKYTYIHTGIFPNKLNIAKKQFIYKKKKDKETTNYRPISHFAYNIENIRKKNHIQTVIPVFFVDNKLLYSSQYGFREGYTIEFTTLELADKIPLEMNKMNTRVNIYLDCSCF